MAVEAQRARRAQRLRLADRRLRRLRQHRVRGAAVPVACARSRRRSSVEAAATRFLAGDRRSTSAVARHVHRTPLSTVPESAGAPHRALEEGERSPDGRRTTGSPRRSATRSRWSVHRSKLQPMPSKLPAELRRDLLRYLGKTSAERARVIGADRAQPPDGGPAHGP
jgi:hypothetical protein